MSPCTQTALNSGVQLHVPVFFNRQPFMKRVFTSNWLPSGNVSISNDARRQGVPLPPPPNVLVGEAVGGVLAKDGAAVGTTGVCVIAGGALVGVAVGGAAAAVSSNIWMTIWAASVCTSGELPLPLVPPTQAPKMRELSNRVRNKACLVGFKGAASAILFNLNERLFYLRFGWVSFLDKAGRFPGFPGLQQNLLEER